ncbi:MAG TPA: DNA recombination protein RmuC [Burkholderiales bacterium]|nr:DNA recombination protein RmuC [Burkholderiales bacterium]
MITNIYFLIAVAFAAGGLASFAFMSRRQGALQSALAVLRVEANAASARLLEVEGECAALKVAIEESQRRHQDSLVSVAGERERALGTLVTVQERAEKLQESLTFAESERGQLQQERAQLIAEHEGATRRAQESEMRLREATELIKTLQAAERQQATRIAELMATDGSLRSELESRSRQLAEQRQWVEEQKLMLEQQFKAMMSQMMEEKSSAFSEFNKKELQSIIEPFKGQLGEFRQRVDHIFQNDTQDRSKLREEIRSLTSFNQTVSKQTLDLTNALTINTKATGNWGETILKRILEDSGLVEGRNYRLQPSITGSEENRQRPDAIIYLPELRQVIVDAKVSNKAWKEYCSATDEIERKEHFRAHVESLRMHIRTLAERNYSGSPELQTVDFVLMFVPVEPALLEVLAFDESLYTDAYQKKVVLVTPTTLMAVVKLIEGIWVVQKRKDSAEKVFEAGRKLYEKLVNFAETFEEIGRSIERMQVQYVKARGQLAKGKGSAIDLAEGMCELGVVPSRGKVLPESLTSLVIPEEQAVDKPADAPTTSSAETAAIKLPEQVLQH